MSKRTNLRVLLSLIGLAALGTCLIFDQGATAAISGIIAACRNFRQRGSWLVYRAAILESGYRTAQEVQYHRASKHAVPGRSI